MKKTKKVLFYLTLITLMIIVPAVILDIIFRVYEQVFLIQTVAPNQTVYDLSSLDYNDAKLLSRKKNEGEYRILSFGDSFAASICQPEYAYSQILENELNALVKVPTVHVFNFGKDGTSFSEYISQFTFWSEAVEYDAVLFNLFAGNDFTDFWNTNLAVTTLKTAEVKPTLQYGLGTQIPSKFPFRFCDYFYALFLSYRYSSTHEGYRESALQLSNDDYMTYMIVACQVYQIQKLPFLSEGILWLSKLLKLVDKIQSQGKKVLCILSPPHFLYSDSIFAQVIAHEKIEPSDIVRTLPAQICSVVQEHLKNEVCIVDLTELIQSYSDQGKQLYYGTNTHWSIEGNAIVGKGVAHFMAENWFNIPITSLSPDPSLLHCIQTTEYPILSTPENAPILSCLLHAVDENLDDEQFLQFLQSTSFQTVNEFSQRLQEKGFHESATFDGYLDYVEESPNSHLLMATGWALNLQNPTDPLYICVLKKNRVVGIGKTRQTRDDITKLFQIPPSTVAYPGFHFLVEIPISSLQNDPEVTLFAISNERLYSKLKINDQFLYKIKF